MDIDNLLMIPSPVDSESSSVHSNKHEESLSPPPLLFPIDKDQAAQGHPFMHLSIHPPGPQWSQSPPSTSTSSNNIFLPNSDSNFHSPMATGSTKNPERQNSTPSASNMLANFVDLAQDQNMICPLCKKVFRFEKNLLRHMQKTHATGEAESVLKCKLCNYTTRHYSNMYVHIRTHTGDKPYSCSGCGASFTQGSSLKLHIKSRHEDNTSYFSLTKKPGKNNLTKLWTRVYKKDLSKYSQYTNFANYVNHFPTLSLPPPPLQPPVSGSSSSSSVGAMHQHPSQHQSDLFMMPFHRFNHPHHHMHHFANYHRNTIHRHLTQRYYNQHHKSIQNHNFLPHSSLHHHHHHHHHNHHAAQPHNHNFASFFHKIPAPTSNSLTTAAVASTPSASASSSLSSTPINPSTIIPKPIKSTAQIRSKNSVLSISQIVNEEEVSDNLEKQQENSKTPITEVTKTRSTIIKTEMSFEKVDTQVFNENFNEKKKSVKDMVQAFFQGNLSSSETSEVLLRLQQLGPSAIPFLKSILASESNSPISNQPTFKLPNFLSAFSDPDLSKSKTNPPIAAFPYLPLRPFSHHNNTQHQSPTSPSHLFMETMSKMCETNPQPFFHKPTNNEMNLSSFYSAMLNNPNLPRPPPASFTSHPLHHPHTGLPMPPPPLPAEFHHNSYSNLLKMFEKLPKPKI